MVPRTSVRAKKYARINLRIRASPKACNGSLAQYGEALIRLVSFVSDRSNLFGLPTKGKDQSCEA
jgi:hypothetical protein